MKALTPLFLLGAVALLGARPSTLPVVHEVSMRQQGEHFEFQPATLKIKRGEVVRFINVSGGPHNVAFDTTGMSAEARERLRNTMKDQLAPLAGPLMMEENQSYEVAFDVPAGSYAFYCMPHMALGMQGSVTVE